MELRTATAQELRTVYERDLKPSFPRAELRPLEAMERLLDAGGYDPLVLVDDGKIVGECFLWLGVPGWAMLDYLCVSPAARNGGLGTELVRLMRELYGNWVIVAEAEAPAEAPDRAMAERRLGFYTRNGARTAAYEAGVFGVRYTVIYWAPGPVDEEDLLVQHRFLYESCFSPERFSRYVRIPAGPEAMPQVPWEE